ncbi:hypothetical protein MJO28_015663 [Puccinia striiformis f. sp. tritici]|uniref:Uncharacterized protein n=1 Tax=Puccinia striiformis f. sp. tritici TaxID=168172 RepID=A0ACC0DR13_9BASI|nr:hypothetical protein MJO28_015663 [Puccinia striiformis f. sp. tritici]
MVIPLCFLADSPKAAEITNTPNPGTSNNPCRVCHLQCPQGEEKSTLKYLQDFFGQPNMPQERHWPSTIANTKNLWICSQTETQKEFEREQQLYGIKDRITFELIARKHGRMDERLRIIQLASFSPNRLYNPFLYLLAFDGCQDTPVEILHVILLGVVKYLWKDFMDFFANNPLIQQSLGYNSDLISSSHYPCQHGHYGPQPPEDQISVRLKTKFPNSNIKKVAAIKISSKEILREGSWVLEADSAVPSGHIVYVESIWEVMPNVYYAKLDRAVKMGVQPENHMTMISKDFRSIYTPVKVGNLCHNQECSEPMLMHKYIILQNLMCCLNVQHNCFSGQCTTIQSTIEATGQKEGASITHKIIHKDDNSFLLNSCSHHAPVAHRAHSNTYSPPISDTWHMLALQQGLDVWRKEVNS